MRRLVLCLILAALPAAAQDREGRNTPGDWVVTHQKPFGLWDSVCDERLEDGAMHRRCYIRYVDVFSPRPSFAAHFVFVTPNGKDVRIEYGSEPGTRFVKDGHRIERDGEIVWQPMQAACLTGGSCVFTGPPGAELYAALRAGGEWRFDFADRHGQVQSLSWDLDPFDAAAADFEAESDERGLR
ncbi:hypothetical protein DEA8626_02136 [Defluviimonas aquaemixtae]|uniref:Uncharacterized protein n=1 Tax=Albidovulum aquaemixtae TaxID=1542388 RepID=A0A2R8B7N4_9RHOB|nr:hypothetical protein [Defluviimonas aquaemixtae]SPH18596.1 hypothetical protein DEA8626_02136 [Defluviimonas aquaemixtae]